MDSKTIEDLAVEKINHILLQTEQIDTSDIKSNDKTPSWDGSVTLYKSRSRKKNNIYGKANIQIKGHEVKENKLAKESIKETVSVSDLKNYRREGGVLYFIVNLVGTEHYSIYCIELLPIIIERVLVGKEQQKTITIEAQKLNYDNEQLIDFIRRFIYNSHHQYSFFQENKHYPISKDLSQLNGPFMLSPLQEIDKGPAVLYQKRDGLLKPLDVMNIANLKITNINLEVYAGNSKIFERNEVQVIWPDKKIILGKGIEIYEDKDLGIRISYCIHGQCEDMIKCLNAMLILDEKHELKIGCNLIIQHISFKTEIKDKIKKQLDILELISNFLRTLHVKKNYDLSNWSAEDFNYIINLAKSVLYGYEINSIEKNEVTFAEMPIGPFCFGLVRTVKDGKMRYFDFFHFEGAKLSLSNRGKVEQGSLFTCLTEGDFLNWDNIDYKEIETDLLKYQNPFNFIRVRHVLLEMLKAYDQNKNQELIQTDYKVSQKLVALENTDDNEFLYFQTKKRIENLSAKDRRRLLEIRDQIRTNPEKCAIEILLGNQETAEFYFDEMNEDEKEAFKANPIYNLLRNSRVGVK